MLSVSMKILIADDELAARYAMSRVLRQEGRELLEAADGDDALRQIRQSAPDLVFLDLQMEPGDGLTVLAELQHDGPPQMPEIIVVTANDSMHAAIECIRRGAADYLTKPYDVDHLRAIARRSEERVLLQRRVAELEHRVDSSAGFGRIRGISQPMQRLFALIDRAARTTLPVLIHGESGTGKELVAQELHARSARAARPFIAVNTAAIATSLVESELFGHVRGAFTGADRARDGVFRQADGGTLFLDEIGDMPATVQTRLLRVLQEGIVQPVGSETGVPVDVRVISATHQDLQQAITDRLFRQDLYFRLRGIELRIPPLRNRQEDILLLAAQFLGPERRLSRDATTALLQHAWPGNVRELQHMMQSAAALADDEIISVRELGLSPITPAAASPDFLQYLDLPLTEARERLVNDFERSAIKHALQLESGNVSAAARRLGIHRQSLQQKIKALEIRP